MVRDGGIIHVAFGYDWGVPFAESAEVFYARSTDEGISWSAWENVSRSDSFTVFFPSLAVDSSGAVHCTWLQFWIDSVGGRHYDCFYSRRDSAGWSEPVNLSGIGPNTSNFLVSAVAVDVRGRVHVVYQGAYNPARYDGAIYHCVFAGDSWTRPYCLTPNPRWENEYPSIACDGRGRLHLAWHLWQYSMNQDTIYYTVYDTTWSTPEVVAAGGLGHGEPSIAVDSLGNPQVVFVTGSLGTYNETFHAKRDSAGWHLTNLSNSPGHTSYHATVTVDPSGRACVVWEELTSYYELLMRTFDGHQWSPTRNITSDTVLSSCHPQLAFPPGANRLDLIWTAFDTEATWVMYMGLSPVSSGAADGGCAPSAHQRSSLVTRSLTIPSGRTSLLLDLTGRKVLDLAPGANDVSRLAPGVYFVREAQAQAHAHAIRKVVITR